MTAAAYGSVGASRDRPNLPFIIGASSVGTLIEWYDFYLYGVLALFFSKHFFSPALDPGVAFILSLFVFWTGFLVRPFGGDRHRAERPVLPDGVWAYATIPLLREIVLVRSTDIGAELLRRGADGAWPEQPELIPEAGDIGLDSVDFRAPLAAFYEDTHLARGGLL